MMSLFSFFIFFTIILQFVLSQNNITLSITPLYELSWTPPVSGIINFTIRTTTEGWIGFGIAEQTSGSMPGSDIATFERDSTGSYVLTDRHATDFAYPEEDSCQDWTMVSQSTMDGVTELQFSRNLEISRDSTQDRAISPGETRFVWALGSSPSLSYHGSSRGSSATTFYGTDSHPSIPIGALNATFRMPNITLPAKLTTYICQSFTLPPIPDGQIISIAPLIDPLRFSSQFTHHMLVHVCEPNPVNDTNANNRWNRYLTADECPSPLGDITRGCISVLYAWARGGGPLVLPEEAGFRMGNATVHGVTHIILEMHYDNRNSVMGVQDDSGIMIFYSENLRPNDAAMITFGDPTITNAPIPPGQPFVEYEAECPSICTQNWSHEINIVADLLHMHEIGTQIWSTIHHTDGTMEDFNRIDFYDFGFQNIIPLQNKVIRPGESLNLHCIYDSTGRTQETRFGIDSTMEMCMEFTVYYPILFQSDGSLFPFCGTILDGDATICGSFQLQSLLSNPNPINADPEGGEVILFGTESSECSSNNQISPELLIYILAPIGVVILLILSLVVIGCIILRRKKIFVSSEKVGSAELSDLD